MKKDSLFFMIVGVMVLSLSLLTFFLHLYFVFGLIFVGVNMVQYSFTGFCPLKKMLNR